MATHIPGLLREPVVISIFFGFGDGQIACDATREMRVDNRSCFVKQQTMLHLARLFSVCVVYIADHKCGIDYRFLLDDCLAKEFSSEDNEM